MTPLPKRRHSTRRGGKRKAAIKLTLPKIIEAKDDVPMRLSHRAYKKDGKYFYKGREVGTV